MLFTASFTSVDAFFHVDARSRGVHTSALPRDGAAYLLACALLLERDEGLFWGRPRSVGSGVAFPYHFISSYLVVKGGSALCIVAWLFALEMGTASALLPSARVPERLCASRCTSTYLRTCVARSDAARDAPARVCCFKSFVSGCRRAPLGPGAACCCSWHLPVVTC